MTTKLVDLLKAILDQAMPDDSPARSAPGDRPRDSGSATGRSTHQASGVNKASVTGYFAPAVRRQLRKLAADTDTTIQALLGEAINDLFAKHGLPKIVDHECSAPVSWDLSYRQDDGIHTPQ